jgi:hypothetical protein
MKMRHGCRVALVLCACALLGSVFEPGAPPPPMPDTRDSALVSASRRTGEPAARAVRLGVARSTSPPVGLWCCGARRLRVPRLVNLSRALSRRLGSIGGSYTPGRAVDTSPYLSYQSSLLWQSNNALPTIQIGSPQLICGLRERGGAARPLARTSYAHRQLNAVLRFAVVRVARAEEVETGTVKSGFGGVGGSSTDAATMKMCVPPASPHGPLTSRPSRARARSDDGLTGDVRGSVRRRP